MSNKDEDAVIDAGMEINDGLAWLQAGQLLADGSPAPAWMHDISGLDIQEAAAIIREHQQT